MRLVLYLLAVLLTVHRGSSLPGAVSESGGEYALFNHLLSNYSKSVRPVKAWSDTLRVKVVVHVKKVAQVVENHQTMKIRVRLQMRWVDSSLTWEPSDHSGLKSITLPAGLIWTPDLHLFNSATEDDLLQPENAQVFSDGQVATSPLTTLFAHCDFDFARFPYDSQTCQFTLGTMLDNVSVQLAAAADAELLPNPEWRVTGVSAGGSHSFLMPGTTHSQQEAFSYDWSVASFTVSVTRASGFYVNLFVWPLVLVLALGSGVFVLPAACVERVSLGVMLLLALVVMSLMMEATAPKSAEPSVVGRLISFDMLMLTLATVLSTLVISVDKENFLMVRKTPQWLKNALLKYAAKIVCKQETLSAVFGSEPVSDGEEIRVIDTEPVVQEVAGERADLARAAALLALINNQIAHERKRLRQSEAASQSKLEWHLVAVVLDRLCLLGYAAVGLLGLFVILV